MYLKGKKYKEPKKAEKLILPKEEAKALIKEFVTDEGKKSYYDICQHVLQHYYKEGKYYSSRDVIVAIKEVNAEWHPPVVEEKIKTINKGV